MVEMGQKSLHTAALSAPCGLHSQTSSVLWGQRGIASDLCPHSSSCFCQLTSPHTSVQVVVRGLSLMGVSKREGYTSLDVR